jgi:hypothetical protein
MHPALGTRWIDLAVDDVTARPYWSGCAADIDVAVWDTTSDVGVPASIACWSTAPARSSHRVRRRLSSDARSHCRALTEAAQVARLIVGSREDIRPPTTSPRRSDFAPGMPVS